MRNHEVTSRHPLLTRDGTLAEPGWSRRLIQTYRKKDIGKPRFRLKEWDYYLVMGESFGVAFTVSDNGYFGLEGASFLDFESAREHTENLVIPFPMGRLSLPEDSSAGVTAYHKKGKLDLEFTARPGSRRLFCDFPGFDGGKGLRCEITLSQPEMDTMVIATPWKEDPKCFYYNQKINCMPAGGTVVYGGNVYTLDPARDFGTLDWGRGVWTYDNTWYWGSGSGLVNGKPFGFNIGYGFSDRSYASENIIFYDGRGHKLDDVTFHIPEGSYTEPWRFSSSDGRFEMDFVPVIDRSANMDFKVISSDQHQVFGHMSGRTVLDSGEVLEIKDLLCFAEKVHNRY